MVETERPPAIPKMRGAGLRRQKEYYRKTSRPNQMWASDGAYLKVCHEALRPLRPALQRAVCVAPDGRRVEGNCLPDQVLWAWRRFGQN